MKCKHCKREIYVGVDSIYYHHKNESAKIGLDYLYCSEGESLTPNSVAEPENA